MVLQTLLLVAGLATLSFCRVTGDESFYGVHHTARTKNRSQDAFFPTLQSSSEANHPGIFDLQRLWWEWNFCSDAVPSKNFTPPSDFVPENTLFLAGYPTRLSPDNVTCNPITIREGTITAGFQTVLIPLITFILYDIADSCDANICCNSTEDEEVYRYQFANEDRQYLLDPENTQYLFLKIDGVDVEPFYIYDNRTYYLQGCPDNRTYEQHFKLFDPNTTGDECDAEPFQKFNGLDVFPQHGWWGYDTREWEVGEQHTFEFGFTGRRCLTSKTTLTAVAPPPSCTGLIGLAFCFFAWFRNILGR